MTSSTLTPNTCNDDADARRTARSNRKDFFVILVCVACIVRALFTGSSFGATLHSSWEKATSDGTATNAAASTIIMDRYLICPEALDYFDEAELHRAIQEAAAFHNLGGSLKSVQLFRDAAIDDTLKKLGLAFVPKDSDEGDDKHNGESEHHQQPVESFTQHLKQYYDANYDPRGGYGQPLPGKFDNEQHKALHEKRWMDVMEPTQGRQRWDAALGPVGPNCTEQTQLGPPRRDGSKAFCTKRKVANETVDHGLDASSDDCHILSVGGNDNWIFESAVREKLQHCTTHTFDCTLPGGKPARKPHDDKILFYNACMHGESHKDSHGRQYLSYSDMLQEMQNTTTADVAPKMFKLDVEGFEYDIFSQMISASLPNGDGVGKQSLPQQIGVELHWGSRMTGLEWMPRMRSSGEIALLSNMMFQAGYLLVQTDFNRHCTSCMEVIYFRAICHPSR